MSTEDDASAAGRLNSIGERIATLREQTTALTERAREVTAQTRAVTTATRVSCQHGVQVQRMEEELAAVEHELDGLRTAMLTRGVIEQAKGMLMMHRRCDAEEAFAVLVELSQTSHRKLVEVAHAIVCEWSAGGHAPP